MHSGSSRLPRAWALARVPLLLGPLLLGLLLLAAPPVAAQPSKAYQKIKDGRAKNVDDYARGLYGMVELCAKERAVALGEEILEQIEELYAPPRKRRKTARSSGVIADPEGDEDELDLGGFVDPVRPEDPDLVERREKAQAKIAALREQLEGLENDPGKERKIRGKRQRVTEKFVDAQKDLAVKCVKRGYPAHAYELLLWTLQFDLNNASLRKSLLGEKSFEDKETGELHWYDAYALKKAKKGFLLHPEYGWVTKEDLKALKAGKLRFLGEWKPKEWVEEQRRDWSNHWTYETEHYRILTNAPLVDAVEFGNEVEKLYAFFFRVFVDVYAHPKKGADPKLVFGGGMNLGHRKLILHYYRSRETYLEVCKTDPELSKDPLLLESAGFYDPGTTKAHFYRTEQGPDLKTIYHEVTHQIFGETYPGAGSEPPTWLVEGLAVYMEDPVVRGEIGTERFLAGAEPPPGIRASQPRNLEQYMRTCGERGVFHGQQRSSNYATGGAVVHFFLNFQGGKYYRGFIRWVREAYKNVTPEVPTSTDELYEYLGATPEQVEADWRAFNLKPDLFDF